MLSAIWAIALSVIMTVGQLLGAASTAGGNAAPPPAARDTSYPQIADAPATASVPATVSVPAVSPATVRPTGPFVTLSRLTAAGGSTVVIRGYQFKGRSRVQIAWDGSFKHLPTAWVGRTGYFRVSFRVPAGSAGQHRVDVYRVRSIVRKVVTLRTQLGIRLTSASLARTHSTAPVGHPKPKPKPRPRPTPPPVSSSGGAYGSINADTKANLRIGPDGTVAHRFLAGTTSALTGVRFSQRGGPVYSSGNGGTLRISVHADSGGHPASASLASLTYSPGNPGGGWTTYLKRNFSSPARLVKGHVYYIVFENVSSSPSRNYISINELFVYGGTLRPRQPTFSDSTYAVLTRNGSWSVEGKYSAVMDLSYSNGHHDGMGYIAAMVEYYATASGSRMFREHFRVSGASRTVRTAAVRVRRTSGSSPLTIRLETGSGALIEAVSVPALSVRASSPGGDNGGSVWVVAHFKRAHVLARGVTYNLRISTASGTAYTTIPVREGTDQGLDSKVFSDGEGQYTTNGSRWVSMYQWSPVDMQFFLR